MGAVEQGGGGRVCINMGINSGENLSGVYVFIICGVFCYHGENGDFELAEEESLRGLILIESQVSYVNICHLLFSRQRVTE